MNYGIPESSMNMITQMMQSRKEIEKAIIFGSRAIGNYKNGSDVDIAIFGDGITLEIVSEVSVKLNEELPLPYYFDILHYGSIKHEALKKHIDDFGKVFYSRSR
jgi:uncharacterized protein